VYGGGGGFARATYVSKKTPVTIKHLLTHTGGLVYGDSGQTQVDALYRQVYHTDMD